MELSLNNFCEGKMTYSDGILEIKYEPGTVITENVLLRQIIYRKGLTKNNDFFLVADLRNVKEVSDEAIELAALNPSPEHIK